MGHRISSKNIKIDRSKVEVIKKLPPPISVRVVISFIGHASFYRQFIHDFLKISCPLSSLLMKDILFVFTDEFSVAFDCFKQNLINVTIVVALEWRQPFELICDASDEAVGIVHG